MQLAMMRSPASGRALICGLLLCTALFLQACGGGGGSASPARPAARTNASTLVSIAISPYPAQFTGFGAPLVSGVGLSWQERAQGTYSDGTTADVTTQATWASSMPAVATINAATGLTMGVSLGSTTITATVGPVTGTKTLQIITGQWTSTGSLPSTENQSPKAILLQNGKVLVVCLGPDGTGAEIYDPSSGTWSTTGSLSVGRESGETATLLQSGMVLVTGGELVGGTSATADVELYDPSSGSWSRAASLPAPLTNHTATLLPNGQVLVVGGGAELYDPTTDSWAATGALSTPRSEHTATLLASGVVLVAGGLAGSAATATAELYDPTSGSWSQTGSLSVARALHTATLLADGRVLVTGGEPIPNNVIDGDGFLTATEIYDPATATWMQTGSSSMGRIEFTTTLLPNGKVLMAGGNCGAGITGDCLGYRTELYDPGSGTWTVIETPLSATYRNTTTLLPSGIVLNVDGGGTAEWYW